jgi:hypothetical protein
MVVPFGWWLGLGGIVAILGMVMGGIVATFGYYRNKP